MRSAYTDYKVYAENAEIVERVVDDLKDRAIAFYESKIHGVSVSDIIYPPNEIIIDDIVLNALADIKRIKDFHPVEKPTFYKYAAYIGFWWQREKPLSCKVRDYGCLEEITTIETFDAIIDVCKSVNEVFLTDAVLDIIQVYPTGESSFCAQNQDGGSRLVSYTDIKDSLCYFFRYRHYSAQELEIFLKGLNVCPFGGAVRSGASNGFVEL